MNTWNRERKRTRDRLLGFGIDVLPFYSSMPSWASIFPWEALPLEPLEAQLLNLLIENSMDENNEDI